MSNSEQVKNITKWIKLCTYISATVLLIANNNLDKFIDLILVRQQIYIYINSLYLNFLEIWFLKLLFSG